jgi:hypothetical protein
LKADRGLLTDRGRSEPGDGDKRPVVFALALLDKRMDNLAILIRTALVEFPALMFIDGKPSVVEPFIGRAIVVSGNKSRG